jgi:hypothetical protein
MGRSKHASPAKRDKKYKAPKTFDEKVARMERNLDAPGLRIKNSLKAQIISAANKQAKRRAGLAEPMSDTQLKGIAIACRIGFKNLCDGNASINDYGDVVQALNMSLVLTERGLGEEHAQALQHALDAAFAVYLRAEETGKWSLDVEHNKGDVEAIDLGLDIHEAQIAVATQAEIIWAVVEVQRRQQADTDVYRKAA